MKIHSIFFLALLILAAPVSSFAEGVETQGPGTEVQEMEDLQPIRRAVPKDEAVRTLADRLRVRQEERDWERRKKPFYQGEEVELEEEEPQDIFGLPVPENDLVNDVGEKMNGLYPAFEFRSALPDAAMPGCHLIPTAITQQVMNWSHQFAQSVSSGVQKVQEWDQRTQNSAWGAFLTGVLLYTGAKTKALNGATARMLVPGVPNKAAKADKILASLPATCEEIEPRKDTSPNTFTDTFTVLCEQEGTNGDNLRSEVAIHETPNGHVIQICSDADRS